MASNIYHRSTFAETLQFLYQCLFSTTIDTLCSNQQRAAHCFPPHHLFTSLQAFAWIHCYSKRPHELHTIGTTSNQTRGWGKQSYHIWFHAFHYWLLNTPNLNSIYGLKLSKRAIAFTHINGLFSTQIFSWKMMHDGGLWVQNSNAILVHTSKDHAEKMHDAFNAPKLNVLDKQWAKGSKNQSQISVTPKYNSISLWTQSMLQNKPNGSKLSHAIVVSVHQTRSRHIISAEQLMSTKLSLHIQF